MLGRIFRNKFQRKILIFNKILSKIEISPNFLSIYSVLISIGACYFITIKSYIPALLWVIIALFLDILDGAVAKASKKETLFGNYIDALTDRYCEFLFYSGFILSGFKIESFLALSGSFLISYAKARTAMVIKIDNHDWPAIGDMFDRMILLCIGLCFAILKPTIFSVSVISLTLYLISIVTHIGAVQRILYARKLIENANR